MIDEKKVSLAARRLSVLMRRDREARAAIAAVLAAEECAGLSDLAAARPEVIVDLDEMFAEIELDDQAMTEWGDSWKPANMDEVPQT